MLPQLTVDGNALDIKRDYEIIITLLVLSTNQRNINPSPNHNIKIRIINKKIKAALKKRATKLIIRELLIT